MNATSERMTSGQKVIWSVVVVCILLLIVIRSFFGQGMGKVYVEAEHMGFVQLVESDATSGEENPGEWVSTASEEGEAFLSTHLDAPTINWTEYKQVEPKAYFAQQQAGSGGPIFLSWTRTIGLWIAGFFTLAIFSFLYRDNPFYKFAECVVVGVSAGYWMVVGFWDTIIPNLVQRLVPGFSKDYFTPGLEVPSGSEYWPNLFYLIPLVLGIMLLCRLLPKVGWLSLWPLAFIVGTTAGLRMVAYIEGDFLSQIKATIIPLYVEGSDTSTPFMQVWSTIWASVAQIVLVVGVLCCLVYFFFSVEHKGVVGGTARVGIWYLMIAFGAAFGLTVMGRIALLAARLEFLFDDWFWIIDPTDQRSLAATAVGILL